MRYKVPYCAYFCVVYSSCYGKQNEYREHTKPDAPGNTGVLHTVGDKARRGVSQRYC